MRQKLCEFESHTRRQVFQLSDLTKELYRNGGKDLFTFSAGETLSIEQLARNNPADLVGYTKYVEYVGRHSYIVPWT